MTFAVSYWTTRYAHFYRNHPVLLYLEHIRARSMIERPFQDAVQFNQSKFVRTQRLELNESRVMELSHQILRDRALAFRSLARMRVSNCLVLLEQFCSVFWGLVCVGAEYGNQRWDSKICIYLCTL